VTTLNSGRVALKKVKNDPPDLILLDVNMPDMSGYEICTQLKDREDTRDIPVVFISALEEVLDKLEAFSIGGADYICKPFALVEVLARVKYHLHSRDRQHQLQTKAQLLETENAYFTEQSLRSPRIQSRIL